MRRMRWSARLRDRECVMVKGMQMICLPSTSTFKTCKRSSSIPLRPRNMPSLVRAGSLRAVARTGTLVVCSRRRANSRPMPRDEGVTSAQGCIAIARVDPHVTVRNTSIVGVRTCSFRHNLITHSRLRTSGGPLSTGLPPEVHVTSSCRFGGFRQL